MDFIKRVVLLMLENRSLDNVCGWLYEGRSPKKFWPEGNTDPYNGLQRDKYSLPIRSEGQVKRFPVRKLESPTDFRVPGYDPNEEFAGVLNQCFGTEDEVTKEPPWAQVPGMRGFLQDYSAWYMSWAEALEICACYTPQQLPVLNGLANQYAISDAWFSSVPTQTNPNRAYSICATSLGQTDNATLAWEQFDTRTMFNVLTDHNVSWGLYYHVDWLIYTKSYTEYTFPHITKAQKPGLTEIAKMDRFYALARSGALPQFTYIEPKWGYGKGKHFTQGNDYHPPTVVSPGEQLVWDVYTALRANEAAWKETLLVVTFDEHGGTYDHEAPPWNAQNPDGKNGDNGFSFNRFGVRVPTLLISPHVYPQTVFRSWDKNVPFDHTSFMKTLFILFGIDPAGVNMGRRMAAAPTFEKVLTPQVVNKGLNLARARKQFDAAETSRVKAEQSRRKAFGPVVAALAAETSPAEKPLEDVSATFEGIPAGITRAIMKLSETPTEMERRCAEYRADPEGYVRSLLPPGVAL